MASTTGINSEIQANYLLESLVGTVNSQLPAIDLFDATHSVPWDLNSPVFRPVEKLQIGDLIAQFQSIMAGVGSELQKEYDAQRITGAKYADVYLALTQGALQSAVQFVLGKDQAFWMAAKTQADAVTSHNQNEVIRLEAMLRRANYALTKLKLATEDSAFGASEYQRTQMLPAQKVMINEQMEAQRAQTSDKRSDGTTNIAGLPQRQMALYEQQKQSYKDDTRIKATKLFSDLFTIMKTTNDAINPPASIDPVGGEANYNSIFTAMKNTAVGT